MFTFPKTIGVREIQRNYRQIFDFVKKTKRTVVVMRNSRPDVAIIGVKRLGELEAIESVFKSREEARRNKAKVLRRSLVELWDETRKSSR